MKRATWSEAATNDLAAIKSYLTENYDAALADKHIAALVRATQWLLDYPGAGSLVGVRKWRKWGPRGVQHVLIYMPVADGIHVVRVRHERANWRPVPKA
jgi:plasmid stabilization system protein ParE